MCAPAQTYDDQATMHLSRAANSFSSGERAPGPVDHRRSNLRSLQSTCCELPECPMKLCTTQGATSFSLLWKSWGCRGMSVCQKPAWLRASVTHLSLEPLYDIFRRNRHHVVPIFWFPPTSFGIAVPERFEETTTGLAVGLGRGEARVAMLESSQRHIWWRRGGGP